MSGQFTEEQGVHSGWEISECLAQWWRPNFEQFMVRDDGPFALPALMYHHLAQYPYFPAHVTKPKECKSLYAVQLPERSQSG